MNTRSKVLVAIMAAAWCTAPFAQSTTTESTTLPGATPQYPPAANSTGLDTGKGMMKKSVGKSHAMAKTDMRNAPTTMASNETKPRTLPARRDRN